MKWEMNAMHSSLKDEIDDGGSLLKQAKVGPFSVMDKALHLMGLSIHIASSYSCRY